MLIVDAHLDLAYNAVEFHDVTVPAAQQPPAPWGGPPSVGLPDLLAGGVGLVCATIFCEPAHGDRPGYTTADEARDQALRQLQWYQKQSSDGRMHFVRSVADLPVPGDEMAAPIPFVLLMEGGDPLRSPADVAEWFAAGLRALGLAWKRTRLAGGTGQPAGISPEGQDVVAELERFGIIHDVSHLAELAFWQLHDMTEGPIMASHSNCRTFVPTDRQLSDDMIRLLARRDGVIGINFYRKFLVPPAQMPRRAALADVVSQALHIAELTGTARHIGLGTDMDGGFGGDVIPHEIATSADLPKVADALSAAGFNDADVAGIMGVNWLEFFRRSLPKST